VRTWTQSARSGLKAEPSVDTFRFVLFDKFCVRAKKAVPPPGCTALSRCARVLALRLLAEGSPFEAVLVTAQGNGVQNRASTAPPGRPTQQE